MHSKESAYALGYAPQDGEIAPDVVLQVLRDDPPPPPGSPAAGSAGELSLGGAFSQAEFDRSAQRLFEGLGRSARGTEV